MTGRAVIPRSTWSAICNAWGGRCAYCGQQSDRLQADHVDAVSRGGRDDLDNIVPACSGCNLSKRDRPLLLWILGKDVARKPDAAKKYRQHMMNWRIDEWALITQASALYEKKEFLRMGPSRLVRAAVLKWAGDYVAKHSAKAS